MGLPEINRARIEALKTELEALGADFEGYTPPPITEESYPNIKSNAPGNVRATALFRTIMVAWSYDYAPYIAKYEVYASKNAGFTPMEADLVWQGRDAGYNHPSSLGETWYFRVRVVNMYGTASDFSEEVSATTINIKDFEIEEKYRLDTISYANQYTDDRKLEIMGVVADKLDAQVYHDNIVLKANITDVNTDFQLVRSDIAKNAEDILLRVAKTTYDADINDATNGLIARMSRAEADISVNAGEIALKATQSELDTRMGDVVDRLDLAEASITLNATNIESKVEKTTYNALEQRVGLAETSISQNSTDIALKASQSDLNALDGRLDTAEATLSVQAGEIATKVEKNGVISSINQSAEAIKINVAQVSIDGDLLVENGLVKLKDLIVDKAHIKDGAIIERMISANVIANVLNAGSAYIDFAKIGQVEITDAHITGRISANKLTIGADTSYASGYDPTQIEVGGTNLALLSKRTITTTSYGMASYYLTEAIPNGTTVTVSLKGTLGSGRTYFGLYNSGGSVELTTLLPSDMGADGVFRKTFTWSVGTSNNTYLQVYHMPNSATSSSTIEWVKLEKGNKATSWSPAPEDIDRSSLVDGWKYPNTTEINGGNIRTGTVDANVLKANSVIANNIKFTGILEGASGSFSGNLNSASIAITNPDYYSQGFVKLRFDRMTISGTNTYKRTGYIDVSSEFNTLLIKGVTGYGDTTFGSQVSLNVEGNIEAQWINFGQYLDASYGRAIQGNDAWLRLNPSGNFTNGIYCGSSILRTDGQLQVGSSGSNFTASSSALRADGTYIPYGHQSTVKLVYTAVDRMSATVSGLGLPAGTYRVTATLRWESGTPVSLNQVAALYVENVTNNGFVIRCTTDHGNYAFASGDWIMVDYRILRVR